MPRTFLDAQSAFDTFAVIYNGQAAVGVFTHGNGLHRTDFGAHTAADTGNAAVDHSGLAFVAVIAF